MSVSQEERDLQIKIDLIEEHLVQGKDRVIALLEERIRTQDAIIASDARLISIQCDLIELYKIRLGEKQRE